MVQLPTATLLCLLGSSMALSSSTAGSRFTPLDTLNDIADENVVAEAGGDGFVPKWWKESIKGLKEGKKQADVAEKQVEQAREFDIISEMTGKPRAPGGEGKGALKEAEAAAAGGWDSAEGKATEETQRDDSKPTPEPIEKIIAPVMSRTESMLTAAEKAAAGGWDSGEGKPEPTEVAAVADDDVVERLFHGPQSGEGKDKLSPAEAAAAGGWDSTKETAKEKGLEEIKAAEEAAGIKQGDAAVMDAAANGGQDAYDTVSGKNA